MRTVASVRVLVLVLGCWCIGAGASASAGASAGAQEKVERLEPIRCWRQASTGAVNIGEEFTVVLTCAVLETASLQVVPEESRLGVASIQMSPFEILGGSHPPDVRRGQRRFLQYDYRLRIISADAIGGDVNVPALSIPYRVRSQVGAAAQLEGRDLSYLLPPLPIRVVSMVPADASDIRDGSEASLAAVDSLRSRANLFRVLAVAFAAFAAVMAVLAFVPLARRTRAAASAERDGAPEAAILSRVGQEIADVQADAGRGGWTDGTLTRALTPIRLLAAAAIGWPVSHKRLPPGAPAPEGRLAVRSGLLRPIVTAVSSSVTTDDVSRAASDGAARSVTERQRLENLQAALATLTAAAYQPNATRDASALDEVLRTSAGLANDLAAERSRWRSLWPR